MKSFELITRSLNFARRKFNEHNDHLLIDSLVSEIHKSRACIPTDKSPVVFFNASTRLEGLSQNAAFSLLSSIALMTQGVHVIYFVCNSGMSRCVLGSNKDNHELEPPCQRCVRNSKGIYKKYETSYFKYNIESDIARQVRALNLNELSNFDYHGIPLGRLVIPSIRWMMRRNHLEDDDATRFFIREFILSGWNIYKNFFNLLVEKKPRAVVVFNGQFFPEAIARFTAQQKKIPVITHEVAIQPYSAFFTAGEATAYPIYIPEKYQLLKKQNEKLDNYLSDRFLGKFSMAGIRFWPEMKQPGEEFQQKAKQFCQIVPIFTNVIFDTSQGHANVLFEDMFTWLDLLVTVIKKNPETLFIIRAHPDESRQGKESRESVAQWVASKSIKQYPNVLFFGPDEYVSSYELIKESKFVMVYNSTIGLEASIMGVPVLCAGKARYTQIPTVFFPKSIKEYNEQLKKFLSSAVIKVPKEFAINARKFLYYQLYKTSLPFNDYLLPDKHWKGYVHLKKFKYSQLLPENSKTMSIIINGILRQEEFILPD